MKKSGWFLVFMMLCSGVMAQSVWTLPAPDTTGGMPLMKALKLRCSHRDFTTRIIPQQVLSNLLWAAWGVNREDKHKRTAPSSRNQQELKLYVAMESGWYWYDAINHALVMQGADDIRAATGKQEFVGVAPLNIIFVADYTKSKSHDVVQQQITSATHAGCVAQNIYLYCASAQLGTVLRGYVDAEALGRLMKLPEQHKVLYAQSVGYVTE